MLPIHVSDLVFTTDDCLIVKIRNPRTAAFLGKNQFAVCHDVVLTSWLKWLVANMLESSKLWCGGYKSFSGVFVLCMSDISIDHQKLTPRSLRAGGATW